jgi:hypothetical protein
MWGFREVMVETQSAQSRTDSTQQPSERREFPEPTEAAFPYSPDPRTFAWVRWIRPDRFGTTLQGKHMSSAHAAPHAFRIQPSA